MSICQFPTGDPRLPDYRICGQPVARPGLQYCAEHMQIAYARSRSRPARLHKSTQRPRGPRLAAVGSNLAEPVS
jgi:hypothetical protein